MPETRPTTHVIRHRSEHGRWQAAIREPDCRQFAGATPVELLGRRLPDRGGVIGDR